MTTEPTPIIAYREPEPQTPGAPHVAQPASIEETGLEQSLLVDLILKTIQISGRPSGRQLAIQMAVSFGVIEELITFLRQAEAVEIVSSSGVGEQGYNYALTGRGREMAEEALARTHYVGPAPVPFQLYTEVLDQQSARGIRIDRDTFRQGLSHLVLNKRVLAALGPAFNSGRSVLIYGSSGNGKTAISAAIEKMLPGQVLIPFAVEIHGQIVKVFDPRTHQRIEEPVNGDRRQGERTNSPAGQERRRDRRWVLARRPAVSVGGELTLADLELRYSSTSRFYIAPLQWKANSGVLIIDDFGRQMIQPQELLNRWIVPMEEGVDHLTLHTGDMVELPFDTLLIFSSNIPPGQLGDEAFFRRIRHKVEVSNPTEAEYLEILQRVCAEKGVPYNESGARYLLDTYYGATGRELKACHPRDVVELLKDMTEFYSDEPTLTPEWLDLACTSYFVDTETS